MTLIGKDEIELNSVKKLLNDLGQCHPPLSLLLAVKLL
jgi:hypothetical protein